MDEPAIKIEEVSKLYQLGTQFHGNLSQALEDRVRAPVRRLMGRAPQQTSPQETQELWALKNVSFEVEPGRAIGLIGANGAGKSTLLKILARITSPTEGRVTLNGRVGSLLEVGTGFHPELTGRENVFLNGAVLGMKRREIMRRFDEIVEFSEIGRFIETPVKRYSSGMFVRLAFAVAAHLENDILLLDEVLAVGDAQFQRKCLEKVDATVADGRTVVFVSHGMSNVMRICDRCAWIDRGELAAIGPTGQVAARYFKNVMETPQGGVAVIGDNVHRTPSLPGAKIRRVALVDRTGHPIRGVNLGQPFSVAMTVEVSEPIESCSFEVGLNSIDGIRAVTAHSSDGGSPPATLHPGTHELHVDLDVRLIPGDFTVDVGIHRVPDGHSYEYLQRVLTFTALPESADGLETYPWESVRGTVQPSSAWSVDSSPTPSGAISPGV